MKTVSATDTNQEFYSDLDDWWGQLWGNRVCAPSPNKKTKEKFFAYVKNRCQEVDDYRLDDDQLSILFSEFINHLSEW